MAKNKKINLQDLSREEKMKYEIAEELGLLDRVLEDGWRTLSAKETGRIGGLVTKRKREEGGRQPDPPACRSRGGIE
ncbi:MAG: small, acid-soluble spore protein, alpha/beta type [Clostridia bacterium]|nr:small, acid-soluble spore protein, alpha/beta type [Clostridia bacterium]NCC43471.1 small, acid-soluble spore protein, alpha/beta type [Clostridia bacterium]